MKKSCLVLQLRRFKVQCLDFVMKVGNLTTLLLNYCEKIFFKKNLSYFSGGVSHEDCLFCDDCSLFAPSNKISKN